MGFITEGSFAAATGEQRLKGERHHALAESTSAPLPKRQRVAESTDHNTDTEVSQSSSSESMEGVETQFPSSQSNVPSEDEILMQVSDVGAFEYILEKWWTSIAFFQMIPIVIHYTHNICIFLICNR
jgi:hypothetical protein